MDREQMIERALHFKSPNCNMEYCSENERCSVCMADFALEVLAKREALDEIHKVASAGCPVGEHPDATFEAISDICAEAKV